MSKTSTHSATPPSKDDLYKIRHSMAHILAQAIKHEFPTAKLGFGPPTETGFYYDFDFGNFEFKKEHLKVVTKRMKKILSSPPQPFASSSYKFDEALKICDELSEPYKKAHVKKLHKQGITEFSFFSHGPFKDLCEGPHVSTTKELPKGAFELHRISGAYWLGDDNAPMLTRIYAHCFSSPEELQVHKKRLEMAKKYDHHKLGADLELFTFDDRVGKGLPLWLPAGTAIRSTIERYAEEMEQQYGYQRVRTPVLGKKELYETSGHLSMYADSMFPPIVCSHEHSDYQEHYYLRPMTCPHHHLIFGHKTRSYRDLPLRLAEYADAFRYEQSGELSGLIRVRNLAINDGHIYLRRSQVGDEIRNILQMHRRYYETFHLTSYTFRLSVRSSSGPQEPSAEQPSDKYQGGDEIWSEAEGILEKVLQDEGLPYVVGVGEAAFYGPKIDIQFRNLMGREETVSTIQVDFLAAENFSLRYINELGNEEKPVVLHRSPLSSHERFMSYLIEYYGGAFPTWCAPVQVGIVPVHDPIHDYAKELMMTLSQHGVRVETALGGESFSKKIRQNMMRKIPITVILGQEELTARSVTIRRFGQKESQNITFDEFLNDLLGEIQNREFRSKHLIPALQLLNDVADAGAHSGGANSRASTSK